MKASTTIAIAGSLALGLAAPALFAQGAKPPVTNPAAAQAKKQADGADDAMAGRKGTPGTAKKGSAQMNQGPGQSPTTPQGPSMRNSQAKAGTAGQPNPQMNQGPGQSPNTPQGPAMRGQAAPSGQGNPGQAGGGQWNKGNEMKGAASAKGAANAKAAQMHK